MHALVATHTDALVELRNVPEPTAALNEAIIEVHSFSLNRGELSLLANRPEGWQQLQEVAQKLRERRVNGKAVFHIA